MNQRKLGIFLSYLNIALQAVIGFFTSQFCFTTSGKANMAFISSWAL